VKKKRIDPLNNKRVQKEKFKIGLDYYIY